MQDGRDTWVVHEGRDAVGRFLIFESDRIVRRVRDVNENWASLTDVDLLAISWNR